MYPGMNFGSGLFGGYPQFGGYGMPQYGGYTPQYGGGYPGYGYGMPQMGGYMPQMGGGYFGGGMFMPGFLDQFQGQLNDMFGKYFGQPSTTTPQISSMQGTFSEEQPVTPPTAPATTTQRAGPSTVGPSTKPYADITGKYYGKTGQLSQGAEQKAIDAYGSTDAFWASEQGQQMQNQRNRRGGKDVNKSNL